MSFLRSCGNALLAIILFCIIILVLLTGYGAIMSRVWEPFGLDYGAEGGRWVWIDERPIYTQSWGAEDAPVIVLLHGLDSAGMASWGSLGQDLSKQGYHVLAIDLEGMGHSYRNPDTLAYTLEVQADILGQVLNEERVQQATVVGHDWGCAVALQLAVDQPQFVKQLILISPVVQSPFAPWEMQLLRVPWLNSAYAWTVYTGGPLVRVLRLTSLTDPTALGAAYWDAVRQTSKIEDTAASWVHIMEQSGLGQSPNLSGLESDVLILRGESDSRVTAEAVQPFLDQIGQAREVVIKEAGHYPHLEQRIQTLGQISDLVSPISR